MRISRICKLHFLIIGTLISLSPISKAEEKEKRICNTTYCKELAVEFEKYRNLSVNPCDNFYEYACGSWSKHNPIPDYENRWSQRYRAQRQIYERLRDLLLEDNENDISPVKAVKQIYRSCLDIDAISKRGIQPIIDILDKTGGWPMIMGSGEWNPKKVPWQMIDREYSRLLGRSIFFKIQYEIDKNNSRKNVLAIDQNHDIFGSSKLEKEADVDTDNSKISPSVRMFLQFAKNRGQKINVVEFNRDFADIMLFIINLQNILGDYEMPAGLHQQRDEMTIEELQKWYDQSGVTDPKAKINFLEVFQHLFKLANIEIKASEPIIVYNKDFYHELAKLLERVSERVLVNYIQWNMVKSLLPYTTQEMRNTRFEMLYKRFNLTGYPPRWLSCVTDLNLKDILSSMFISRYSSDEVIEKTNDMVQNIQDAFQELITNSQTLPQETKTLMNEKVKSVKRQISHPNWYRNQTILLQEYEGLTAGTDYFQNVLNYKEFEFTKDLKELRQRNSIMRWQEQPTSVNAYYFGGTNSILIPVSQLQDPFFTPTLPDAINYGFIGLIIGHEMSHSVDTQQIRFDSKGRIVPWRYTIIQRYYNKVHCLVDQYNKYSIFVNNGTGFMLEIPGETTKNENLADNIGVKVAYRAFKKIQQTKNYDMKLPGMEIISGDELFFLSVANKWCGEARPKYAEYFYPSNEHSPNNFRVLGSLSNMPEFAATYNCPPGSPMNPQNKCSIF